MENKEKDLKLNRTSFAFSSRRTDIKPDISKDMVNTSFSLSGELFDRLKVFCAQKRCTKNVVLRAALAEYLEREEKK